MAVAKSYEGLTQVGAPFIENGREYVYVICKNGNQKKVRWYTDAAREKMDAAAAKKKQQQTGSDFETFNAHDAFFFGAKNNITIYKATEEQILKWREELPPLTILQNAWFGFYSSFPLTPPTGVEAFTLNWNEICRTDDEKCMAMKDGDIVQHYVAEKLYGRSVSQYQGQPDEWLVHSVTIKKNIAELTNYGETHTHVMVDVDGNEYVWTTSTKNLTENETYLLKMKVKEHKEFHGVKQTIVYYCKVI